MNQTGGATNAKGESTIKVGVDASQTKAGVPRAQLFPTKQVEQRWQMDRLSFINLFKERVAKAMKAGAGGNPSRFALRSALEQADKDLGGKHPEQGQPGADELQKANDEIAADISQLLKTVQTPEY